MTDPWGNPLPPEDRPPTSPQPEDYPPSFASMPPAPQNPAWPGPASFSGATPQPPQPPQQPMPPGAFPGPIPGQAPMGYQQWMGPKTSGLAIASLICSLIGLLACGIILCPLGFGLGLGARASIAKSGGTRKGDGLAIAGIVIGIIGTTLAIVTMVFVFRNPDVLDNLFTTTTTTTGKLQGA